METYEAFTKKGSRIIQAEGMKTAIIQFYKENGYEDEVVQITEVKYRDSIAPANREIAIEIVQEIYGEYDPNYDDWSPSERSVDALINEGLLLGKSVNEEIEKRVKDLEGLCRFASIPELIIKNPTFIKADKSPLTEKEREWAEKSIADYEKKLQKFNVKNEPTEGVYDLSWDEELYNAFCDCYHDDGSNDEALQKRLKSLLLKFLKANNAKSLSSSIVYPTNEQINKIMKNPIYDATDGEKQMIYEGAKATIELIKSLNSSRESEPTIPISNNKKQTN